MLSLDLEKMTLAEAVQKSTAETANPSELSEVRLWLAGRYAYLGGELTKILMEKPSKWTAIRQSGETKSDAATEKLWAASQEGQREMQINIERKSIEKLLSAINSRIDVLRGESFNRY